ncbi:MAG TPA: ANTAR domain-containing protein [Umezawaea sp.]|nr:ANTAR domain-containing protein [Umezawaea sp.]
MLRTEPVAVDDSSTALGQMLADIATIGILQQRAIEQGDQVAEQLQTALNSRVVIEQARGVIAERGGLSMDDAFARLRPRQQPSPEAVGACCGAGPHRPRRRSRRPKVLALRRYFVVVFEYERGRRCEV